MKGIRQPRCQICKYSLISLPQQVSSQTKCLSHSSEKHHGARPGQWIPCAAGGFNACWEHHEHRSTHICGCIVCRSVGCEPTTQKLMHSSSSSPVLLRNTSHSFSPVLRILSLQLQTPLLHIPHQGFDFLRRPRRSNLARVLAEGSCLVSHLACLGWPRVNMASKMHKTKAGSQRYFNPSWPRKKTPKARNEGPTTNPKRGANKTCWCSVGNEGMNLRGTLKGNHQLDGFSWGHSHFSFPTEHQQEKTTRPAARSGAS